jgi:bifunctional DNA-binding transcriptional regulator/antitoxin component of YhaV-PrlF toxin-antitoxin module
MSDSMSTHRPTYGTQTGRVWEIADKLSLDLGRKARRQEVIDAYAREGGNTNTASTQYSHWNKGSFVAPRASPKSGVHLDVSPVRLEIGRDGRILLPFEIRSALRLGESPVLTAAVQDGVLTLMSPRTAAIKLQQLVKATDKGTGSVVEELIAERRAENAKE